MTSSASKLQHVVRFALNGTIDLFHEALESFHSRISSLASDESFPCRR
jgi:hypothetical protein